MVYIDTYKFIDLSKQSMNTLASLTEGMLRKRGFYAEVFRCSTFFSPPGSFRNHIWRTGRDAHIIFCVRFRRWWRNCLCQLVLFQYLAACCSTERRHALGDCGALSHELAGCGSPQPHRES